MNELAFGKGPSPTAYPVQGTVVSVGKETVDVDGQGRILRNLQIARPLKIEEVQVSDVVSLSWVNETAYVVAVLGHKDAHRRDPYRDTNPPPAPLNVRVEQGRYGAILKWRWGAGAGSEQERTQLAYYEVDARVPGGTWGYDLYPVSEGTREYHIATLNRPLQVRVRAVDLRGNESNWVVASDLLVDTIPPEAPANFTVSDEVGGVLCTWVGPEIGNVADLAGFFLYIADPVGIPLTGATGFGATGIMTGSVESTINVGLTYEFRHTLYPGKSKFFNITAFDRAGNESEFGYEYWVLGTSRVGARGANLLSNADWTTNLTPYTFSDIDWWNCYIFNGLATTYPTIGNVGRGGSRGASYTIPDGAYGTALWPEDTQTGTGQDFFNVLADDNQYITCSIYFRTNLSSDLIHVGYYEAPLAADPPEDSLTVSVYPWYLGEWIGYDHRGDPVGQSLQYLGNSWYRVSMTYLSEQYAASPQLCFGFRAYNETGATEIIDVDRPQMEWGPQPTEWAPGVNPGMGGTASAGLRVDSAGIVTGDGTFQLTHQGQLQSHWLPDADNTYDLGSEALQWRNAYFGGTVYADQFSGGTGAPTDAQYLTLALDDDLTNERQWVTGDGLDQDDQGAGSTFTVSVDVTDFIDTSYGLTEDTNNIRVNLASPSGLEFATGALQVNDTIAGNGLTISTKVLAVGAGDGIDVSADAIAVDVTDIIDTNYGLTENSNDIRISLASPSGLEFSTGALQIVDGIAGNGLTISSKVLAVGAGDGIDVAADAIAVDVTDLLGNGLTESSNNIDVDPLQLERGGNAQIDGDHLDIDWNPTNYTPATTPSEAANVDDLTAHLYGIDQALGSVGADLTDEQFLVLALSGDLTNERQWVTGDGLDQDDQGAGSTYTVSVDVTDIIDTSYGLTENSNNIRVNLASPSGLEFSTGALQIVDGIAGDGLTITSKVLAVGAGDGIDVAADSIAVDVTDILGDGLTESSNNIQIGTPSSVSVTSTNNVLGSTHSHAATCSDAPSGASILACTAGVKLTLTDLQLNSLTASTLVYSDPSKEIQSLANSGGYLYNNGSGSLSWASGADPVAHNLLSASHGDTAAHTAAAGDLIVANGSNYWDGLALTVPDPGVLNYVGVNNGESQPSWKSASSNPGAQESLLSTTAEGLLSVVEVHVDTIRGRQSGDLVIGPSGSVLVTSDLEVHSDSAKVMDISSGSVALGEVASSQANVYYNDSNKRVEFRGGTDGTEVGAYIETDGSLVADLDVNVTELITPPLSPSQLTGNVNNYNPGTDTVVRLSSNGADYQVTGWANGESGKWLIVFNYGSYNLIFKNASTSSTDVNRFANASAGDVALPPLGSLWYIYMASRWRQILFPALA